MKIPGLAVQKGREVRTAPAREEVSGIKLKRF